MRILFLAGSLEPGKSGVGDYTYLLAASVADRGHECDLISLNDPWVKKADTQITQVSGVRLRVTRCPQRSDNGGSEAALRSVLKEREPDWVCLQFVSYAYADRGMVWPKLRHLASILRERKTEVMFHELWIGDYPGAPLRERMVGLLQRLMILRFLRRLRPRRVHTSIPLYRQRLLQSRVGSDLLPMFGTIQATEAPEEGWIYPLFANAGIPLTPGSRSLYLAAAFFGSIYPGAPFDETLEALKDEARRREKKLVLLSIGEPGPGISVWDELTMRHSRDVYFLRLGRQSETRISEVLRFLDMGLTTTPLDIIGKSSSVAAMLEHGLPVMALDAGKSNRPLPDSIPDGLFHWQALFTENFSLPGRRPLRSGAADAAERLILSLRGKNCDCAFPSLPAIS